MALPKPEVEPTTVVDRVFPSGDRLPENQLKLSRADAAAQVELPGPVVGLVDLDQRDRVRERNRVADLTG